MNLLDELSIDYTMLKMQREELVKLIWQDKDTDLWGLVDLLDALIEAQELVGSLIERYDSRIVRIDSNGNKFLGDD